MFSTLDLGFKKTNDLNILEAIIMMTTVVHTSRFQVYLGPSINYVRNFTCYLDPSPLFCMQYAIKMYRRVDPPPPPHTHTLPLGAYVINGRPLRTDSLCCFCQMLIIESKVVR